MILNIIFQGTGDLADKEESSAEIEQIKKRLDMLDRRFDNIDSIVSAVTERIMKQPVILNVTCTKCGQKIEIAIMGIVKPNR